MKQNFRRLLGLGLAILLLVYTFQGISFGELAVQFKQANYGLITLYSFVTLSIYFVRGKRWQQPLLALGFSPSAFRATIAMQTGMVASMVVPGSGELTRCLTLQRTDQVPVAQGLGSVLAERVLDFLMLPLLLLITFLLQVDKMLTYWADLRVARPGMWLLALAIIATISIIIGWMLWRKSFIHRYSFVKRVVAFSKDLGKGFLSIRYLPNPTLFVFLTLLAQVLTWFSIYLLLLALPVTRNIPLVAPLTILSVASVGGLAVPTQGAIGTYHLLVGRALILYGLSMTEGVAVATFIHTMGFGINVLLNSVSFLIVPLLITRSDQKASKVTS